jgi:hypothetical protein
MHPKIQHLRRELSGGRPTMDRRTQKTISKDDNGTSQHNNNNNEDPTSKQ